MNFAIFSNEMANEFYNDDTIIVAGMPKIDTFDVDFDQH